MALPEMTAEQLLDRCDLAAIAHVVSVGRASPDSPNLAKLRLVEAVKGEARVDRSGCVYVRLHGGAAAAEIGEGDLAAWSDWWDYPVGAAVLAHLDWNGPDAVYQTTWPGAVREVNVPAEARVA